MKIMFIILCFMSLNLYSQVMTYTYDAKGNRLTKEITNAIAKPTINGDTVACNNAMVTYTAHGGVTYLWSNGRTDSTISVRADSSQTLRVYAYSSSGCADSASIHLHVKPLPVIGAIIGDSSVCVGAHLSLSDSVTGGTWYSGNSNASILAGVVTGIAAGNGIITYSVTNNGCTSAVTKNITVNPLPIAGSISGSGTICVGSTALLTNTITGGTWSSGNLLVASVSAAGWVSGVGAGNALISYTVTNGCGATSAIRAVTINPLPGSITGLAHVCAGSSTTLGNSVAGGSWISSNPAIATISSAGLVTGVAQGVDTIFYTLPSGCMSSLAFSVNAMPAAITGIVPLCPGSAISLANAVPGGSWSSSNSSVASISSTGSCNAVISGTATVAYTLGTGCQATGVITVNPQPAAISGLSAVCEGASITLTNATTGGSWISSNNSIATISISGLLRGITTGRDTIQYRMPSGCVTSAVVTVNPMPGSISGASAVCTGATISLNDTTTGGTWICSNTTLATISNTGTVTGISAGAPVISYLLPTGCFKTSVINVNPLPSAITGPSNVCVGSLMVLSESTTSGIWSSSNLSIATVSGSGIVRGIAPGIDTICYRLATGCFVNAIINVNSMPANITGSNAVCIGASISLNDTSSGGTWSSSNSSIATISSAGLVTGITSGTVTITYLLPSGCYVTKSVIVNPAPSSITGLSAVCVGATISLSSSSTGGTWQSLSTTVASISSSGLVRGLSPGTDSISYRLSTGCTVYTVVSVNPLPAAIVGLRTVCPANNISLSDTTIGGTWSSNNITIATVASSGTVTGIAAGTVTVSYTLPTGCFASIPITVNPLPAAITGPSSVCSGITISLANATTGGTWISSNIAIATISGSGILRGVMAGTDTITYRLSTGCSVTAPVIVNTTPSSITGFSTVCIGASITLTDTSGIGAWSSSNSFIATVSPEGVVSGISAGTTSITYSLSPCYVTKLITVNPLPGAITGTSVVCEGSNTMLASTTSGGTWISSNNSIASVSTSGLVRGVSAGMDTITYRASTGCIVTTSFLVNPNPSPILGSQSLCVGASISLTDTTIGGAWSCSNTTIASISSSGYLTGIASGNVIISYQLGSGCNARASILVNQLPPDIVGGSAVCSGQTMTLTNLASGGTWLTTNPSIATVSNMGLVLGVAPGADTIKYQLSTGCLASARIEVNALPEPITGPTAVCVGEHIDISNSISGGGWSVSNTSVATISGTGTVTGLAAGNATVTYQLPTGCYVTTLITVNSLPANIIGPSNVCTGNTISLSDEAAGGVWSVSNVLIATISGSGIVSGISAGIASISYVLPTGCAVHTTVSVNAVPAFISGLSSICAGSTIDLSDTSYGGAWSSSDIRFATVNVSGQVYGVASGSVVITYALSTGCFASKVITINPLPGSITGTTSFCMGSNTILSTSSGGGLWSSTDPSIATVNSFGIVTSVSSGTTLINYSLPSGCTTTITVSVNPLPSSISGLDAVCVGNLISLSNSAPGGIWSISDASIASVSAIGVLHGILDGTTSVIYTLSNGCHTQKVITVNPVPTAITGMTTLCVGRNELLSNSTAGGIWISGDTTVATISYSGLLSANSYGSTYVSYILPTGCISSTSINVNANPVGIIGGTSVCEMNHIILSDSTTGGIWSSSNSSIATVSGSGDVLGVTSGTVTISYMLANSCYVTNVISVNELPSSITGVTNVCQNNSTILTNTSSGGTWSSSDTTIASINSAGIVFGTTAGTTSITYQLLTGCQTSIPMIVNSVPPAISGNDSVCVNSSIILTNSISGGVWTSSNSSIATISDSGIVYGVSAGTAIISYVLPTGCQVSKLVRVNSIPSFISGPGAVCEQGVVSLVNSIAGGHWSTNNASVLEISATGYVSGLSSGTAIVSYTLPNGCYTISSMYVEPTPSPILGSDSVCVNDYISLFDSMSGGSWSVLNIAIATISNEGTLFGISSGSLVVSYSMATGCYVTKVVKVNAVPLPITGPSNVCVGLSVEFSDLTTNGTWLSSNTTVATVSELGIVTGIANGTTTVSYLNRSGCYTSADIVVVSPSHLDVNTNTICQGTNLVMPVQPYWGVWRSSNPAIATIDDFGTVLGVSSGTAIISYVFTSGCPDTAAITVKPLPRFLNDTAGEICSGEFFKFFPELDNQGASFSWTRSNANSIAPEFASGNDSIDENITNTTLQPVECDYICTLNSNGCSNIQILSIQVNPRPTASITTAPGKSVCLNALSQNFGAQSNDGNLNYSWATINADIAAAQRGRCLIDFKTTGESSIILEENVTGYQCYSSDTFRIMVNDATMPEVTVEYEHPTFIATPNVGMDSYQWGYDDLRTLDSTAVEGAINSRFVNARPDFDGKHYWIITTKDGCMQKTYCSKLITTMDVMPNPSMGFVQVVFTGDTLTDCHIEVTDMLGQKMANYSVIANAVIVDLSKFSSGTYLISAYEKNVRIGVKRVVKQ